MTRDPFGWAFANPDLLLLYAAAMLVLLGWLVWSGAKILTVYAKVYTGVRAKVHGERLSAEKRAKLPAHVLEAALVTAVNLVLVGAYIHLVTA